MKKALSTIAFGFAATVAFTGVAAAQTTLEQVRERGELICGSNPGLAGFGVPDAQGNWTGFDVDYCRATAAAIFGDPNAVSFIPLSAKDRFTALQAGEIDVLFRNSTSTITRDTSLGLDFPGINYYDGQGFLVSTELGVTSALELDGASVCVQQGTTTELNLADYFRRNNMDYEPVTFAQSVEAVEAYLSGRCDAFTTDASGLASERLRAPTPSDHIILPEIISKEPLGPVVRHGDNQWADIIRWVHYAMLEAEEYGITSENAAELRDTSEAPGIRRILGTEGNFGEMLGLGNDWAFNIISMVGNYGEVFDRNIGEGSPVGLSRGLNALYTDGGLQYGHPIR
ncbi:amino acid ABC transporter substrate-binding protein [Salinarimonas ramus]|uniref:Amino acid ABC transporter substrate-binding protein n=1 Tax=Salinarimonas ramus TaxID=690164 RepID=A0A917VA81_9HYPH|nr:amino acid ABC transporter substrate-binding protein [Salinarimonas ramus]GGK54377.1 amino acid ABC transporter substrate-binding protein [Salinarimonas ramus]